MKLAVGKNIASALLPLIATSLTGFLLSCANPSVAAEVTPSALSSSSEVTPVQTTNVLKDSDLNEPVPPVRLRSNLQVDGEGVFLSQLVEPKAELPRLRLCDAPAFGKSLALKRQDITSLAASAGLD